MYSFQAIFNKYTNGGMNTILADSKLGDAGERGIGESRYTAENVALAWTSWSNYGELSVGARESG